MIEEPIHFFFVLPTRTSQEPRKRNGYGHSNCTPHCDSLIVPFFRVITQLGPPQPAPEILQPSCVRTPVSHRLLQRVHEDGIAGHGALQDQVLCFVESKLPVE